MPKLTLKKSKTLAPIYGLDPETTRRLFAGVPNRQRNNFLKALLRHAATMPTYEKLAAIQAERLVALKASAE